MNNRTFTEKYYIERKDTASIKWARGRQMGCLPMWIADMDFRCDDRIIAHLNDFITYGDYGYANLPEDYYDTVIAWHKKRNNVAYRQEWFRSSKGAVDAMYQVIHAFTKENDPIMINTPLYPPFRDTILKTKRKVVESKLIDTDGFFTFDYADIETKFKEKKVKLLMLCSPHNPVGRVWKKGELEELFALCKKYRVLICSDEVHSDIIMPDQTFYPALSFKEYQDRIISIIAASKSFSLAVFSHSHIVIASEKLRNRLIAYQQLHHAGGINVANALPTYYAYRYGKEWMDALNNVVFENYHYIKDHLGRYLNMTPLEGSYLLFLDLGKYSDQESASQCLIDHCKILTNPGEAFSKRYNSWVRVNLATSLDNIRKAVDAILGYIEKADK